MAKKHKATKGSAEAPTSSCLLICDDVLMSFCKNRHILHGVVDNVTVGSVPANIGPYVAYVRLANVYADQKLVLRFSVADTDEEIFRFEAQSPSKSSPLATHTLILRIPDFEIQAAGRYMFQAMHGGVAFAESQIEIVLTEEESTP